MNVPKKIIGLSSVVVINFALQFLFQWLIIIYFGAGTISDAYFGAMVVPQFVLLVLSGSLTLVLVPILSQFSGSDFNKQLWTYFQAIAILFTAIALLLLCTAQWWVHLLFPSFKGEAYQLSLNLARIQLIAMVISALLSVIWAARSAREHFFLIESSSIIANVIALVLFYFLIKLYGIYAAAWVSVLRVLLQLLFLVKVLGPYQKPLFTSPDFTVSWKKLRPLLAGNLYYKTDTIIDRHLSASGANGELTLFNLAQQIYAVGYSILSKILVNTMVPQMAKAHAADNKNEYNRIFKKRLFLTLITTAILYIFFLIFGKWGLALIFAVKNFNPIYIGKLWWIMVLLGGYFVIGLASAITAGTFYAQGNTVTPTRLGAVIFTLFIPIKIFCYHRYGIEGLAFAITVFYFTGFVTQLFFLKKHLNTE